MHEQIASSILGTILSVTFAVLVLWTAKKRDYQQFLTLAVLVGASGVGSDDFSSITHPWVRYVGYTVSLFCIAAINARAALSFWIMRKEHAERKRGLRDLGYVVFTLGIAYATVFKRIGVHDLMSGAISHNLFSACYLVAITWTTVGYGDVVPVGTIGRAFAALAALNGYALLAAFIATLMAYFLSSDD